MFVETQSFDKLEEMLGQAIDYCNHTRYRSTLNFRTPSAFIKVYLGSAPSRRIAGFPGGAHSPGGWNRVEQW